MATADIAELTAIADMEPDALAGHLGDWLDSVPDASLRAQQVAALEVAPRERVLQALDEADLAELFDHASPHDGADVLADLPESMRARILSAAAPDVIAEIIRRLPEDEQEAVRQALPRGRRTVLNDLLSWPEDSVGARMTPHVTSISDALTVKQANRAARAQA